MSVKSIVSLLPAATEIIYALGLENQLAGRSHKCIYPENARRLPACTFSEILTETSSGGVNQRMSENAAAFYLDKILIRQLNPDVIIVQSHGDACGVSGKEAQEALPELQFISLQFTTLSDVFNNIKVLSEYFNVEDRGARLLEDLQERVELVKHKLKFIDKKPKTVCVEWLSPLMTAGNWIPELVKAAGGMPVLLESGKPHPYIEADTLASADPEVILIAPRGFSISQSLQKINLLTEIPGWNDLDAVKNGQVYIADGSHYFNCPGVRMVDSIEILAEILNPKQFVFGYEGEGWIKFDFTAE